MSLALRSRESSRHDEVRSFGFWGRFRQLYITVVATLAARRMLARIVRPYRSRGSPRIPPHLLEDIGLPRDRFDPPRSHWDLR